MKKGITGTWLSCYSPGYHCALPSIGHNYEYPFQRIIPVKAQILHQSMWAFLPGWLPVDGEHIQLNGAFHTLCLILCFVVASAAEAESGVLFLNCEKDIRFWLNLKDLGDSQPKTSVHCDNATAVGIANKPLNGNILGPWK
jgi:hypothetical protein